MKGIRYVLIKVQEENWVVILDIQHLTSRFQRKWINRQKLKNLEWVYVCGSHTENKNVKLIL